MAGLDERFVRAFVADGSGLARQDVHPAQDQAPAPRRLFATVLLIDDAPYGGLIIGSDRKDGDERAYVHHRRALYSVQFFRKGAVAAAHRFSSWAETDGGLLAAEGGTRDVPPRGEDPAWPNGIQVRLDFPIAVRRIDEIVKDGFEERAGLELAMRYADTFTEPDIGVDSVPLTVATGTRNPVDGTITRS